MVKKADTKKIKKNKKLETDFSGSNILEESMDSGIEKEVLVTKEGLAQMKEEFEYLKGEGRRKVAERLKEAISFGDLSENSEYEEAKNEQGFVEGRITELERKIKYAKIITESTDAKIVMIGSKVKIVNLTKNEESDFVIVGSTEADPFLGKISNESPVGSALLDKKKGDKVKVIVPGGTVEYQIKKID